MSPDVYVLLAALRADHPYHTVARAWLTGALADAAAGGSVVILPMVAAGFLRLATHPRVFNPPTPVELAIKFLETLLESPGVEYGELGRE